MASGQSAADTPRVLSLLEVFFGKKKPGDDNGLRILLIIMTFGFLAIIIVSIWMSAQAGKKVFWSTLGLSCLIALASMMVGGFLGFLFGIPRSLQKNESSDRYYSNNTNLEQISDWLTKIIVGVSLTQLPALQHRLELLFSSISQSYPTGVPANVVYMFGAALVTFYSIAGFLGVYIWAKIYLLQQLTKVERELYKEFGQKLIAKVSKLEVARLSGMLTDFSRSKNYIAALEQQSPFASMIQTAQPQPAQFIQDFQKGRWGGKSTQPPYELTASIAANPPSSEYRFTVTLLVRSSDAAKPVTGTVLFFLHDSFGEDYLKSVEATDGVASISFPSFEAFTVGAILNEGKVKLELDLNEIATCPEDYKYSAPLLTFDEVKKELDAIKSQQ